MKANIATDVYSRSMDTPITITQRELLSLSPEVRSQVREAITTKRIPMVGNPETNIEVANFLRIGDSDNEDEVPIFLTFAIPNSQLLRFISFSIPLLCLTLRTSFFLHTYFYCLLIYAYSSTYSCTVHAVMHS